MLMLKRGDRISTRKERRLKQTVERIRTSVAFVLVHNDGLIGPILWGHSGPLCHALSLSSLSWTSMRRRRATVPLATSGEWA